MHRSISFSFRFFHRIAAWTATRTIDWTGAEQNEPLDRPVGFESATFSESAPFDTARSTGSESNGHGFRQNLEWTYDTVSTLTLADHAF